MFPGGITLSQLISKYNSVTAAGLRGSEAADSGSHELNISPLKRRELLVRSSKASPTLSVNTFLLKLLIFI